MADREMIVAGIGCRRLCPASDVVGAVRDAEAAAGCTVDALAAPEFKRDEPGIHLAAARLALPLLFVSRADLLRAQPGCVTRSDLALASTGLASVAEAAALAATSSGRLVLPRITRGHATCALAQGRGSPTRNMEDTEAMRPSTAGPQP
jgi:cobalt-precorrin 5A hydrolase